MGLNPLTLRFAPEIERIYARESFEKSLPQIRFSILVGILLFGAFGLLDSLLVPDLKSRFWFLRFVVALPWAVAVFLFSFSRHFERYRHLAVTALMVLAGLIIIAMIVMAPAPVTYSYYAGLILVFMWGYSFTRAPFLWATAGAWILVGAYEIAAIALTRIPTPVTVLINNNFFFISANFLGMLACYSIDYFDRRDFHLSYLLRKERENVFFMNQELEVKVLARTRELVQTNRQLRREFKVRARAEEENVRLGERLARSEKMEAIGRLAGGVAHDLNNVLGAIVGYPDLILRTLPENNPNRKRILSIRNSGQKAAAIVQDLLTLARRGVTTTETVVLNELVEEYLDSPEFQKLRTRHPEVRVRKDLDPNLGALQGSAIHLTKTIMNLVSNAAEALPEGGEIRIRTRNHHDDPAGNTYPETAESDLVLLEISDDGVGIAEKDQKKIFEPFYTKKFMGHSGSGLGMSVVWGTVEDHSGRIEIQSVLGRGTTFLLYFPRGGDGAPVEVADSDHAALQGNGETVLVVDDVREQRELARAFLEDLGYRVLEAENGETAMGFFRKTAPDLVLLDMIMGPGMDGLDTYRGILELQPGMRAIVATGFSETERVRSAIDLGAGGCILKPFTLETLGTAVRNELKRNRT